VGCEADLRRDQCAPHCAAGVINRGLHGYAAAQVEEAIGLWADYMIAEDFSDPRHGQDPSLVSRGAMR